MSETIGPSKMQVLVCRQFARENGRKSTCGYRQIRHPREPGDTVPGSVVGTVHSWDLHRPHAGGRHYNRGGNLKEKIMSLRVLIVALSTTWLCAASPARAEKRLNNFVVELVNVGGAQAGVYEFDVPFETWLFVRVTGGDGAKLLLDDRAAPLSTPEAMQFVDAGSHKITLDKEVARLEVRRIPEIQYCSFPYHPWVWRMGPYDWDFLEKHINPHVTTMIGSRGRDQSQYAERWRAAGKRWIVQTLAPGLTERKALSLDKTIEGLTEAFDTTPYLNGILVDEYYGSLSMLFDVTGEALKKIAADPKYAGKKIDPFVAGNQVKMASFLKDTFDAGYRVAFEAYNHEQPTQEAAKTYLQMRLSATLRGYQAIYKEANRKSIIALGILSTAPESLNVNPHVNYKVFQDMEFHHLANAPDCKDVFGVMGYTAGYAEEETIRWLGRLYRHYCIEGNTERLSDDPYLLGTVQNGDFDDGTKGWDVFPAQKDSIEVREFKNFGKMAARMSGDGNHVLAMKRSAQVPNVVTQTIRNLTPGRLYCLRMYSSSLNKASSYGNPGFNDIQTLNIDIQNVDLIPERSIQHVYISIRAKKEDKMFYNFHFKLFRAKATTARLIVSDWESDTEPGGRIGQELMFNYIEVQPYFEK